MYKSGENSDKSGIEIMESRTGINNSVRIPAFLSWLCLLLYEIHYYFYLSDNIKKSKPLWLTLLMWDNSVCMAFSCHFKRIISCTNSLLRMAILAVIRACTALGISLCGTVTLDQ